jgi:23S rRNA (cytidine1920-2'-O)/16S rRNA (cytidine1409-2'-O)-methyltransferase
MYDSFPGGLSLPESPSPNFVTRAGHKLAAALDAFGVNPAGLVCADLGCNVGGFVDCLLQRGGAKVYAIDTGYGALAWKLRTDPRVVVMERTNAMHVVLPEAMDLVTVDVAWTPQHRILPNALKLLKPGGRVVTLIKPHYEADRGQLCGGVLPREAMAGVLEVVSQRLAEVGIRLEAIIESPIAGQKGNIEHLALLSS